MGYPEGNKYFEEDSYKISWDGKCKNGYASSLGREIETADMIDKWGIAIYKKGKPTYYIINNILSNILFEGINIHNQDDNYGIETIIKNKNGNIITGEYINNVAKQFNLPKTYNQKADAILRKIYNTQQKAFQAQEQAQKVKKQYLKRICKDSIKVKFMDNNEYNEICHPKSELAIMKKINNKLNKISEAKIAKLEKERYTAQQQKEEQHRQELLQMERNRLSEIRRHNQETEAATDASHFQQGMKNLTDQINNMTPKTYNINHSGSINMYSY